MSRRAKMPHPWIPDFPKMTNRCSLVVACLIRSPHPTSFLPVFFLADVEGIAVVVTAVVTAVVVVFFTLLFSSSSSHFAAAMALLPLILVSSFTLLLPPLLCSCTRGWATTIGPKRRPAISGLSFTKAFEIPKRLDGTADAPEVVELPLLASMYFPCFCAPFLFSLSLLFFSFSSFSSSCLLSSFSFSPLIFFVAFSLHRSSSSIAPASMTMHVGLVQGQWTNDPLVGSIGRARTKALRPHLTPLSMGGMTASESEGEGEGEDESESESAPFSPPTVDDEGRETKCFLLIL